MEYDVIEIPLLGKWVLKGSGFFVCSNCDFCIGQGPFEPEDTRYCKNCGLKMDNRQFNHVLNSTYGMYGDKFVVPHKLYPKIKKDQMIFGVDLAKEESE